MLQRLYDWTHFARRRARAREWWLGFIAFVESSVFVIPAEVMFVPMGLARPERVWRYARHRDGHVGRSAACSAGSSATTPTNTSAGRCSSFTAPGDKFEELRDADERNSVSC